MLLPSWLHHRSGAGEIVRTPERYEALWKEGWRDTPAAFLVPEVSEQPVNDPEIPESCPEPEPIPEPILKRRGGRPRKA